MPTEDQLASEVAAWLCGHEGAKAIVVERTEGAGEDKIVRRARYIVGCSSCGEMVGWLDSQRQLQLFEDEEKLGRTIANLKAVPTVVHAHGTPHFVHKRENGITTAINYCPLSKPDVTCPRCLEWIEDGRPMVVRG